MFRHDHQRCVQTQLCGPACAHLFFSTEVFIMKFKNTLQALVILALMMLALLLPAYAVSADDTASKDITEERLAMLGKALEAKRLEHHIPGMAIAIVKDDAVIMARGFGQMDLAANKPVTTETLFAIGSTTKAFTATLVGMLKDEQQMDWDDLITQYLPNYQFTADGENLPITLRDLLAHRTGFIRNDLLWASGQASREKILKTATQAESWDDFRDSFRYNNVMFLAAGQALAQQTGMSWDQLLNQRILKPLGMTATTSRFAEAIKSPHIATGYQWNDALEAHEVLPRRNLDNVAPAGSIYSNVNDMAQWLRLQLNQGQFKQQQLISAAQLQTTHQAHNQVRSGVDYGLGWFLRRWQDQAVVEHGGSIDGYGAQVALLPAAKLGFVLLTNVTATPLQQESMALVWEHLIEQPAEPDTNSTVDYQEFVGEYHANFASFKDSTFTFLIKEDGKPAVDVPGQMVYELKNPDAAGKWYFAMTDEVAVSFDRATDGTIKAMRMHQKRLDFELPKKGVPIEPEIDAAALQPYLGQYQSKLFKGSIKAMIQNHRLTIDVPNEMAFELHLPDAEGHRQFRIKADMSAVFKTDGQGEVYAIELYRDRVKLLDTAVKAGQADSLLPTVDEIMELRRTKQQLKAMQQHGGFALSGTVHAVNSGVKGQISTRFNSDTEYRQDMTFGDFGKIVVVANKAGAVTYGIRPYTEFHGKYLQQIRLDHPAANVDWQKHYESVTVVGTAEVAGRPVYVMRLKNPGLPSVTSMVDQQTGDVLQQQVKTMVPHAGAMPMTISYADYRDQQGIRMPYQVTIKNNMMGNTVIRYDELKTAVKFSADTFSTEAQ